jgi:tubulin polyglutamylase TTLL6/13
VKPEALSQGKGIFLSRSLEEIVDSCKEEGCVVQRYIHKPYLIDDLKFDLRIYVLLYGVNPLRIYIHEMGLARFATEYY